MNHSLGIKVLMRVGGLLTLMIGIGHIFMPTFGYESNVIENMGPELAEHFYYLGTYAICMFLIGFSALSLFFSKCKHPLASAFVCTTLCVFWFGRAVLEFIYPAHLPIFFLSDPHTVLAPVIVALAVVYFVATAKSWYVVKHA